MAKIKALESSKTIVLKYKDEIINIQKSSQPELFKKVSNLILNKDQAGLIEEFTKASKNIAEYAGEDFSVKHGVLTMKKTGEVMPTCIAKKLQELNKEGADYQPLLNFWEKLKKNPSESSKKELYKFMLHNNISLTPDGDFIVEKGVSQINGRLVDCHSGQIDNSIGSVVEMKREDVDNDRRRTCSKGLHVAPKCYVRQFYSSGIIIECLVNPVDVVSVPIDYSNRKMRVCKYMVIGYADDSKKPTVREHSEILSNSPIPEVETIPKVQIDRAGGYKVISKKAELDEVLSKMTAKEVNNYVHIQTGEWIVDADSMSTVEFKNKMKSKKRILKKAREILVGELKEKEKMQKLAKKKRQEEGVESAPLKNLESAAGILQVDTTTSLEGETVVFTGLSAKQIVKKVHQDFKVNIGGAKPRRARVVKRAIKMYSEKNITVVD